MRGEPMAKAIPEVTRRAFINEIAPVAQKAYKTLGKVLPSICIAMACVESAYGTSQVMRAHNAFLGHKVGSGKTATKYWDGTFFNAKTSEEYTLGTHTAIKANFRSFKDTEQCIFNFYELLNSSVYKNVLANVDYKTQMQQIKACGYMTSSTEVNTVYSIIAKYVLTSYDPKTAKTNPYSLTSSIIKMGSSGESVKWVQFELNASGANLVEDGIFGNKTKLAVLEFQRNHGLSQDGIVGPKTIASLKNC